MRFIGLPTEDGVWTYTVPPTTTTNSTENTPIEADAASAIAPGDIINTPSEAVSSAIATNVIDHTFLVTHNESDESSDSVLKEIDAFFSQ